MKLFSEKVDEDFRHGIEFIMRVKPYREEDLLKKDYLTFLKILKECERDEARAIEQLEKSD